MDSGSRNIERNFGHLPLADYHNRQELLVMTHSVHVVFDL